MKTKIFTFFFALVASVGTVLASDTQVDGIWYNFNSGNNTASVTFKGSSMGEYDNEYSGSLTIPSSVTYNGKTYSVTSIGKSAFQQCWNLRYITIPNSVTSIGEYAFRDCGLYEIEIPSSITSISNQTFFRCENLTSVTIPNSVTSIGDAAFMNCSDLLYITIPHRVTSIEEDAFWYCTSLISVTIGESVTGIGSRAFDDCTSLTSVTVYSNAVMTSENMKKTFGEQVQEYIIGEGVTSINNSAFDGCSYLVSVTLDKGVANIGDYAFKGCGRLRNFYNKSTTPQLISANVFENAEVKNCKLYVPKASIGLYEEEPYWKDFMKILPLEESSIQNMEYPSNVEQIKIIKEGKVLIKRGDKEYDMTGKEVR